MESLYLFTLYALTMTCTQRVLGEDLLLQLIVNAYNIQVLVLLVPVLAFISVHIPFHALCIIFYLYFLFTSYNIVRMSR